MTENVIQNIFEKRQFHEGMGYLSLYVSFYLIVITLFLVPDDVADDI